MRNVSTRRALLLVPLLGVSSASQASNMAALAVIVVVACIGAAIAVLAVVNAVLVWMGFYRTRRPTGSHLIAFVLAAFGLMYIAGESSQIGGSDMLVLVAMIVLPTLAAFLPPEIQHRHAQRQG